MQETRENFCDNFARGFALQSFLKGGFNIVAMGANTRLLLFSPVGRRTVRIWLNIQPHIPLRAARV